MPRRIGRVESVFRKSFLNHSTSLYFSLSKFVCRTRPVRRKAVAMMMAKMVYFVAVNAR